MGNPIAGSEFGMQIVRAVTSTFKYLGVDASWAQETFKLWRQKHKSIAVGKCKMGLTSVCCRDNAPAQNSRKN